jgi:hypothetical protein
MPKKKKPLDVSKEIQKSFFDIKKEKTKEPEDELETVIEEIIQEPLTNEIEEPEVLVEDDEMVLTKQNEESDYEVTIIRKNAPPKPSWSDNNAKFKCGERIIPKTLPAERYSSFECACVISPGKDFNTFHVKLSRCLNETLVFGNDWITAPKDCKPYVSYWEGVK